MLSEIKNRILSSLEGGGFQDLCDALLYAEGYEGIFQHGMKPGTLKTTIGNPDTYFQSDLGKYIFVVYTTEQKNVDKKIKKDIEKCLDKEKTGVDVVDIEKIICCHTSSTLKAGEDKSLRILCDTYGIKLVLYGIDEIANKIYRHYQYLAKDYLHLSIDSNQIFHIDEFIRRYDSSNGMNAPLRTVFLHRKKEKEKILESLEKEQVLLISGKAGVGKTRLSLEAAKEYQEKSGCKLFCVKCNHMPIMEDLCRYISGAGKYLIFVDDANELAEMSYLLDYIFRNDDGYDVRIIATVRDYAKKSLLNEISKLIEPKCILISKLTDWEIQEFIELNLKIENINCLNQIVRISGGNPRIAYMAGKLAKERDDLQSIMNVEGLYKSYYSCFLDSTKILTDSKLSLTAGIVSVFNAVNLENLDRVQDIFDVIKMTKEEFIEDIYSLHDMEYVEIKLKKVARISDQCLSNYMLYYVLFVKKLVRFSDLLKIGFQMFRNSIVKSVDTLTSIFSSDDLNDYLTEEINKVWNEFKTDDKIFYDFVKEFYSYKPEETLIYVNEKIEEADACEIDITKLKYLIAEWNNNLNDHILRLLVGFGEIGCAEEAIELAIKYCIKKQDIVKEVYCLIESHYSINMYSSRDGYRTQNIVVNIIKENMDVPVIKKLFYKVAALYLSLQYLFVEAEDEGELTSYQIEVRLSEASKHYRLNIWTEIISLTKCVENAEDTIWFLEYYSRFYVRNDLQLEVLKFDWEYLLLILDELKLYLEPFHFAYVYSRLLRVPKGCFFEEMKKYSDIFEIEEWNLYKVLSDRFYRSITNFYEAETVLATNIKNFIEGYPSAHMEVIVKNISNIIKMIGSEKADMKRGVDSLCALLTHDKERLGIFVSAYFKYGDNIDLQSSIIVGGLLGNFDRQEVFNIIWNAVIPKKRQWQFEYFQMIDSEKVTQEDYQQFMHLIEEMTAINIEDKLEIDLRMLDKLKAYSSDIYKSVTKTLLNKIGGDANALGMYFSSLFNQNFYTPKELLHIYCGMEDDLKFIYFKCIEKSYFTDYSGAFLSGFVSNDIDWIKCYARYIRGKCENDGIENEEHRMDFCWRRDNYLEIFDTFFEELACDKKLFWISTRYLQNIFTFNDEEIIKKKKEEWIIHYIREKHDSENIIGLFRVLQNKSTDIRKKAILCFLEYNPDFERFKKLRLVSDSWGGKDDLTKKIKFYEELLPQIKGIDFLEHKKFIKEQILMWKHYRNNEEQERILMGLYE